MYENFSIIMKEGCQGQKPTINNIEGIAVPLPDGRQFKLMPKYKNCALLNEDRIAELKNKRYNEAQAIFNNDNKAETDEYLRLDSPAAKHVREFGYDLPSFTMAAAIVKFIDEINAVAETIEGADIIDEDSYVWSSCRFSTGYAWFFYGSYGHAGNGYFSYGYLAVPVAL